MVSDRRWPWRTRLACWLYDRFGGWVFEHAAPKWESEAQPDLAAQWEEEERAAAYDHIASSAYDAGAEDGYTQGFEDGRRDTPMRGGW